jgi:hypothetical protein
MAVTPPVGTAGGGGDVGAGRGGVVVGTGRDTGVVGGVVGGSVGRGRGGNVEVVTDGAGCAFVVDGTVVTDPAVPAERTNDPARP